jgi:hypothetical protein
MAEVARGLGCRKQQLNRRYIGLVDGGAIQLQPFLPLERLAEQIIGDPNAADAAVRGETKRLMRVLLRFHFDPALDWPMLTTCVSFNGFGDLRSEHANTAAVVVESIQGAIGASSVTGVPLSHRLIGAAYKYALAAA